MELLDITPARLEYAWQRMQQARDHDNLGPAEIGMRAARARDEKFLRVLEKCAEIMNKMSEEQTGRTRRDPGTPRGERLEHTESQLMREAYRLCDEGNPISNFAWQYAVAAYLAGYVT